MLALSTGINVPWINRVNTGIASFKRRGGTYIDNFFVSDELDGMAGPTVDNEIASGDIGGARTGKKSHQIGHFVRLAETA